MTYDTTYTVYYVNGFETARVNNAGTIVPMASLLLVGDSDRYTWNWRTADLRFYTKALTKDEVLVLADREQPIPWYLNTSMIAYYDGSNPNPMMVGQNREPYICKKQLVVQGLSPNVIGTIGAFPLLPLAWVLPQISRCR